ncbi:MAG: hypothetical protein ACI9S9_004238, partial [Planctomycetota bacterium]
MPNRLGRVSGHRELQWQIGGHMGRSSALERLT